VDELVGGLEAIVLKDVRLVVAGIWRDFGAANGSVIPDETCAPPAWPTR